MKIKVSGVPYEVDSESLKQENEVSDGGKGSAPRPIEDWARFEKNWDEIFKPEVKSPCVEVCFLNFEQGMCMGCKRTLNEIENWSSMSTEQKRALVEALKTRELHG